MSGIALLPIVLFVASAWLPGCEYLGWYTNGNPPPDANWRLIANVTRSLYDSSIRGAWPIAAAAFLIGVLMMAAAPLLAYRRARHPTRPIWQIADLTLFCPWLTVLILADGGHGIRYGLYVLMISFALEWLVLTMAASVGRPIDPVVY